jgi:hypothetical protein
MTAVSDEAVTQLKKIHAQLSRVVGKHPEGSVEQFIKSWWIEEQSAGCEFWLGCPDWRDRPAMIFLAYAIRCLCGMHHSEAIRLAEMAVKELKRTRKGKALAGDPLICPSGQQASDAGSRLETKICPGNSNQQETRT